LGAEFFAMSRRKEERKMWGGFDCTRKNLVDAEGLQKEGEKGDVPVGNSV
jgi:hypothetical protein